VAEIELPAEDSPFKLPEWIGEEVSHDMRYTNSNLCAVPFSEWKKED
jgi:adenylate cyclase